MAKTIIQLPKSVKLAMASISDRDARTHYKNAMLEAQAALLSSKNRKFSDPAVSQQKRDRTQS